MFAAMVLPLVLLAADTERPRHPLAPSLPLLSQTEEAETEKVVERFIQADTGQLKGAEAKQAFADFNKLGPEAIFVLIDGFNRAANMQASCPAVLIGKKIASVLGSTEDTELLTFAKETIGIGVTAPRHMGVVRDLQFGCTLRRTELKQRVRVGSTNFPGGGPKLPDAMSLPELKTAVTKAKGPRLQALLTEAEKRKDPKVVGLLAESAHSTDAEVRRLGQGLLAKRLEREPPENIKGLLRDENAQIRALAASVVGRKQLPCVPELIALLGDIDPAVQQAARQGLVRLAGVDHGPRPAADSLGRELARTRWLAWWESTSAR